MSRFAAAAWARLKRITPTEWLVVIAVIAVVVALLWPGPKWGSSGTITIPIQVLVFDPVQDKPIANARVSKMRPPAYLKPGGLDLRRQLIPDEFSTTDVTGSVTIDFEFPTSAGTGRPAPYAHLWSAWVVVDATGYGGVVMPVRYQSMPTAELREQGSLQVVIGLLRPK